MHDKTQDCEPDGAASRIWEGSMAECVTHHACDCIQAELDTMRPVVEAAIAACDEWDVSDYLPQLATAVHDYREASNG